MIGTWLFTLFSILPLGLWSIYSLTAEGWMSNKGPVEKAMKIILWVGISYQILLPFYWCYILAPKGIPFF